MGFKRWRVLAFSEFLVIAGMLAAFTPGWEGLKVADEEPAGTPDMIQGIDIHYQYEREGFFPGLWLNDPFNCTGAQVDRMQAARAVPLIRQFAASYDPQMLHTNLTNIYLVSDLHCYGKPYGGTNNASSVYVRVGRRAEGYSNEVVLATLHQEFSSILFRHYKFPAQEWELASGDPYQYPDDSTEVLDHDGLRDAPTMDLLRGGFLSTYAATSLENDFNEMAGWLFVWPDRLCKYAGQYPAVARKAALAAAFYRSIEPGFVAWECE